MDAENYNRILITIIESQYFGLVGFVLTISSIIIAYIFYKRSKKHVSLKYTKSTYNVIQQSDQYKKLNIFYDDNELSEFSITQIVIKNNGNTSIKKSDISPSNSLRLSADTCDLLDVEVVYQKNTSDNLIITHDDDEGTAIFEFDYINPGEYFVIKVLHTGTQEESLKMSGEIIGETSAFSLSHGNIEKTPFRFLQKMMISALLSPMLSKYFIGFMFINLALLSFWYVFYKSSHVAIEIILFIFGLRAIYLALKIIFKKVDEEEQRYKMDAISKMATNSTLEAIQEMLRNHQK